MARAYEHEEEDVFRTIRLENISYVEWSPGSRQVTVHFSGDHKLELVKDTPDGAEELYRGLRAALHESA